MTYPNPLETPEMKKEIAQLKANVGTFEDFLKEEHATYYKGTDDNMPDSYDQWLTTLGADDWIELGEAYAKTKLV